MDQTEARIDMAAPKAPWMKVNIRCHGGELALKVVLVCDRKLILFPRKGGGTLFSNLNFLTGLH